MRSCSLMGSAGLSLFIILLCVSFVIPQDSGPPDGAESISSVTVRVTFEAPTNTEATHLKLDLGLGFPFRIAQPEQGSIPPIEALPHEVSAQSNGATTTVIASFLTDEPPPSDLRERTLALLADLQVSDISRIGIITPPEEEITLEAIQIEVNGRVLHAHDQINTSTRTLRQSAQEQHEAAIDRLQTLQTKITEIEAFVDVGLASEDETHQLAILIEERLGLEQEYQRLRGIIRGTYPVYIDDTFRGKPIETALIQTGEVTFVTADHTQSGTDAQVFLQLGGKKFLLDSESSKSLDSGIGSAGTEVGKAFAGGQRFELDLNATPLRASDIRGYSVGLIDGNSAGSNVPDRWHLVRMVIELDDRVVFDSDESDVNRRSLEAIRIIPPVQLNASGQPIRHQTSARECTVWKAGHGQGLDWNHGGAFPLPPPGSSNAPQPEPQGPNDPGAPSNGSPGFDDGTWEIPPTSPTGPPNFPGEAPGPGADLWSDGGADAGPGWQPWPSDPGGPAPGWNTPGFPGGAAGGGGAWNLLDKIVTWLLSQLPPLPPGVDPPPSGDPFSIDQVRLVKGWQHKDKFEITWKTMGDVQQIERFDVSLVAVHPHQQQDVFGPGVFGTAQALPIDQSASVAWTLPPPGTPVPLVSSYFAPVVTAIPKDPAATPFQRIGPAHLIFPAGTVPLDQLQLETNYFALEGKPGQPISAKSGPVGFQKPNDSLVDAAWVAGELDSHNAVLFADAKPGINCVLRPHSNGDTQQMSISLTKKNIGQKGGYRFRGTLAFVGRSPNGNRATVDVMAYLRSTTSGKVHAYPPQTVSLSDPAGGDPAAAIELTQVVDEADANFGEPTELVIVLSVNTEKTDPEFPIALMGLAVDTLQP